ncbi:hypothetical protein RYX36_017873, partial [Vicia faba]
VREDHPQIYPTNLNNLLKKKLAFRVKYSMFYKQCSVIMLNRDEQIYKIINEYMNPNETQSTKHNVSETSSTNTPSKIFRFDDLSPTMCLTPQHSATKVKHMKKE